MLLIGHLFVVGTVATGEIPRIVCRFRKHRKY